MVGEMTHKKLSQGLRKKLAIRTSRFWPEVLGSIYSHLGIILMHQNARALLGRITSEVDISFSF